MGGANPGGKGGGSDPKGKGFGAVLAVGIALALGVGGVSAGASGATASGSSASEGASAGRASSRSGQRVSQKDSTAAQARLAARGVKISGRLTDDDSNCSSHSYGQVQQYFADHPCASLHRAHLEVRDPKGDVALVAVSWVEMPTEAEARELKTLLDTGGTGNVTELSREKGRYRGVRYTGYAYDSDRDGTVVVNAQAQPVARGWAGLTLTEIVTNAVR